LCKQCRQAKYCGKKCQIADWRIHKHECYANGGEKRKEREGSEQKKETKKQKGTLSDEEIESKARDLQLRLEAIEKLQKAIEISEEEEEIEKQQQVVSAMAASFVQAINILDDESKIKLAKSYNGRAMFFQAILTHVAEITVFLVQFYEITEEEFNTAVEEKEYRVVRAMLAKIDKQIEEKKEEDKKLFGHVLQLESRANSTEFPLDEEEQREIRQRIEEIKLQMLEKQEELKKIKKIKDDALRQIVLRNGDEEMIVLLIENGADVNSTIDRGRYLLYQVAETKNLNMMKLLLEHGADPNAVNSWLVSESVIFLALDTKNIDMAELLLKYGANVDAKDVFGNPILTKVPIQNVEWVRLLLRHGADANSREKFRGPVLVKAVKGEVVEVVSLLLAYGADANARDTEWKSVLHLAVEKKNVDIVRLLLSKNANVNASEKDGKTILSIAIRKGNREIIRLLKEAGAK